MKPSVLRTKFAQQGKHLKDTDFVGSTPRDLANDIMAYYKFIPKSIIKGNIKTKGFRQIITLDVLVSNKYGCMFATVNDKGNKVDGKIEVYGDEKQLDYFGLSKALHIIWIKKEEGQKRPFKCVL